MSGGIVVFVALWMGEALHTKFISTADVFGAADEGLNVIIVSVWRSLRLYE